MRAHPTDSLTMLLGVFNGSPVSAHATGDPQAANPSGTSFPPRLNTISARSRPAEKNQSPT